MADIGTNDHGVWLRATPRGIVLKTMICTFKLEVDLETGQNVSKQAHDRWEVLKFTLDYPKGYRLAARFPDPPESDSVSEAESTYTAFYR